MLLLSHLISKLTKLLFEVVLQSLRNVFDDSSLINLGLLR